MKINFYILQAIFSFGFVFILSQDYEIASIHFMLLIVAMLGSFGIGVLSESCTPKNTLKLPCNVGDTVWAVSELFEDKKIHEGTIVEIEIDEFGFSGLLVQFSGYPLGKDFTEEEIGELVFFSKEDAVANETVNEDT